MTSKSETITPATAIKYLAANKHNRSVRAKVVEKYAREMRNGHWLLTHQGIAFDEDGNLIDGQHRLLAIAESGCSIPIMVTRGLPVCQKNGIELFTMDVLDGMKARSVGDNLAVSHGVDNGNRTAAYAGNIALNCYGHQFPLTTPQALGILNIYGPQIESAIKTLSPFAAGAVAPVGGTIAFCAKSHQDQVSEFAYKLATGEEIKRGMPVYALRNYLINGGHSNFTNAERRTILREVTANAIYNMVIGESLTQIKRGQNGLNFFRAKQRANVEKVRILLGAKQ